MVRSCSAASSPQTTQTGQTISRHRPQVREDLVDVHRSIMSRRLVVAALRAGQVATAQCDIAVWMGLGHCITSECRRSDQSVRRHVQRVRALFVKLSDWPPDQGFPHRREQPRIVPRETFRGDNQCFLTTEHSPSHSCHLKTVRRTFRLLRKG